MRLSGTTRDRISAVRVPGWHEPPKIPQHRSPAASRPWGSGEGTEDPMSDPGTLRGLLWAPLRFILLGSRLDHCEAPQELTPEVRGLTAETPSTLEVPHWKAKGKGREFSPIPGFRGISDRDLATLPQILLTKPLYPHRRHPGSSGFLETSSLATVARPWTRHFRRGGLARFREARGGRAQ